MELFSRFLMKVISLTNIGDFLRVKNFLAGIIFLSYDASFDLLVELIWYILFHSLNRSSHNKLIRCSGSGQSILDNLLNLLRGLIGIFNILALPAGQ